MKYSVLIFLFLFQQNLLGQSTFNLEYIDNEFNSSGVQVFEFENYYYLVSRSLYLADIATNGTTVRKVDTQGNEVDFVLLNNANKGFSTNLYGCGIMSDGTIVVAGTTLVDDVEHIVLQRVSSELELIGDAFEFASPYNPNLMDEEFELIRPSAVYIDDENNVYLAAIIYDGNFDGFDVLFCKLNSDLQLSWEYIHEVPGDQVVYSISVLDDILYSFQMGEFDFEENSLEKRLIKIGEDDNGQPYITANIFIDFYEANRINEAMWDDGGFVITGARIDNLALENSPIVFKINIDGLYQWYSEPTLPFHDENQTYFGVARAHGGGYVCVGREFDYGDNEQGWEYDADTFGNFSKHTELGTLEWHRRFTIIESCDEIHAFFDVVHIEDGYLIYGTRADYCIDQNWESVYPRERSWLVKTDECGCIVPGCGEKDCFIGLDEETPDQLNILLYPNPSNDYCSIYIPEGFQSQYLQVFNSLGQLIIEKNGLVDDTTYIIPVSSWENGIYILNVVSENNVVESHKIEVLSPGIH